VGLGAYPPRVKVACVTDLDGAGNRRDGSVNAAGKGGEHTDDGQRDDAENNRVLSHRLAILPLAEPPEQCDGVGRDMVCILFTSFRSISRSSEGTAGSGPLKGGYAHRTVPHRSRPRSNLSGVLEHERPVQRLVCAECGRERDDHEHG